MIAVRLSFGPVLFRRRTIRDVHLAETPHTQVALLGMTERLDEAELAELEQLIADARKAQQS